MLTLDDPKTMKAAICAALSIGFIHAEVGQKPATEGRLIALLRTNLGGQFSYRPYQARLLRTAYGVPLTNRKWVDYIAKNPKP